jgi:Flp pilus assembly protein TadB
MKTVKITALVVLSALILSVMPVAVFGYIDVFNSEINVETTGSVHAQM